MKPAKKQITKIIAIIFLLIFNGMYVLASNGLTDIEITNAVQSELMLNSATPSFLIDIETNNGVVILSGQVNDMLAKDRAVKIARTIKGVRAVVNKIEVDVPERDDTALENDIEDAWLKDPATDSYEIFANAVDGEVTLTGTVESWQEKQLAEYVVKGVKGVRGITNNINVDYVSERTDYEIKKDIEQRLTNDIRIDDGLVEVSVNDANVTLSGTVGSASEKYLATTNSWVMGVNSVSADELEVEQWARDETMRKNKYVKKTDNAIREAVEDAFLYDPRIYSFNPDITVENGIVTLTGEVDNFKAKRAAEKDAKNVVGVFGVNNLLKVRPLHIPEDAELESKVQEALSEDPVIEKWEVNVTANNGIVYLNGEVDTYFEKLEAKDVASKTKGVIAVENNIEVGDENDYYNYDYYGWNTPFPPAQIGIEESFMSDKEIKNRINSHLWWSPYVNEDDVQVSVSDGTATLTGIVDTRREKLYAEINAMKGGAEEINNNLIVEYGNE